MQHILGAFKSEEQEKYFGGSLYCRSKSAACIKAA